MQRRALVLTGVAIAAIAYARCRSAVSPSADVPATATSGEAHEANALAAALKAAAAARSAHIHITAGDLRLEGEAVDEKEQPIAGATITLDHERTTVSETDGSFAFDNLAPGDYQLSGEHDAAYGEDDVVLHAKSELEVLTLRIGPTVAVHVVDHAGTAVVGAKVSAGQHSDAFTDASGTVRLRAMELGDDPIDVTAVGLASAHVIVAAGDDPTRIIDKRVVLGPSALVAGVVLDETGAPIADARVMIETTSRSWSDSVDTDPQGHWQVAGFGAGKIIASASSTTHIATPDITVPLDGVHPKLDVVLRVEHGATIGGIVVDSTGKPVVDARVGAGSGQATTDDHGRFLVTGLDPGPTDIRVDAERFGAPIQQVTLARGGHVEVRFVVTESGIAGTVRDSHGDPVPDARVMAGGPTDMYARADGFGHFELEGLPPGDYSLSALRDGDHGDPERTAIAHSGDRHVALVVPDVATVVGRVVMNGVPVDYFGVVVTSDPDPSYETPDPVRASDGRFTHDGIRPGTWSVSVIGPSFQRKTVKDVVIASGAPVDLGDIEVTPGRSVHGRVVDPAGQPVVGADVAVATNERSVSELSLRGEIRGTRGGHTDAAGRFEISGLPDDLAGATIEASEPDRGLALPRPLHDYELATDVELRLEATGAIIGTVANGKPDEIYRAHLSSSADDRSYGAHVVNGEFSIAQLPPGDYLATLRSSVVVPPVVVHVVANVTTSIEFALPAAAVTVDITTLDACTGITITAPDATGASTWTPSASCADEHHAEAIEMAPGRYRFCNVGCTTVDIAPSPAHQQVIISEQHVD